MKGLLIRATIFLSVFAYFNKSCAIYIFLLKTTSTVLIKGGGWKDVTRSLQHRDILRITLGDTIMKGHLYAIYAVPLFFEQVLSRSTIEDILGSDHTSVYILIVGKAFPKVVTLRLT